ncbi:MAG: hypothetical protein HYU59_01195 [Magnetospirillum gryphiswaldense]|nr:hypothetical protein [Magnetospirillum gryphiswaldense]
MAEFKLPTIAYIDENEDARADFFTDAYQSGLFKEVHVLAPEARLSEMVDKLLDLHIDAVISDFQLTEAGPVDYNGEALVEAVLAKRAGFPCFIRTSFADEALKAAEDVNRVYSKNPNASTGGREQLLQRIVIQIERHRTRLAEWRIELEKLLVIDRNDLTAAQIDRIVELDEAIEKNIALDASVSPNVKRDVLDREGLSSREAELIRATEKLITEMRQALNE